MPRGNGTGPRGQGMGNRKGRGTCKTKTVSQGSGRRKGRAGGQDKNRDGRGKG